MYNALGVRERTDNAVKVVDVNKLLFLFGIIKKLIQLSNKIHA
jgi:hypothetical protein